jgi:hypothetical protein
MAQDEWPTPAPPLGSDAGDFYAYCAILGGFSILYSFPYTVSPTGDVSPSGRSFWSQMGNTERLLETLERELRKSVIYAF